MDGGIDQDQLDRLFTAALEASIARIEKDGTFFPLLFELRPNDAIHNVAVLETATIEGRQSVLDRFAELLRPRIAAGRVAAAAIAIHRQPEAVIEVRLRAPNYSADVSAPYELKRKGLLGHRRRLSIGDIAGRPVPNELF